MVRLNRTEFFFKDKMKVSIKGRTPRTRPSRSAAAPETAASAVESDDLFSTPSSTKEPTSSVAVVVVAPAPIVSPPAPSTGLPSAAPIATKTAATKEKKKFSLFDSDDSDIDQLLFGSERSRLVHPH